MVKLDLKTKGFLLFFSPIFTKGIRAKLNELESESDFSLKMRGKFGKSELTTLKGPQPIVQWLVICSKIESVTHSVTHSVTMSPIELSDSRLDN